jgi:hypothetical protein
MRRRIHVCHMRRRIHVCVNSPWHSADTGHVERVAVRVGSEGGGIHGIKRLKSAIAAA